ncbi:polysaccharide pyruvyl transferase family protein [Clostridium boliviensis]|uniref:Polysaccharide pyruvyl transferase family protein n=1 Tax=Clostridium boliviensis TaxID=318465 RepID=A0ABU4GQ76_9CLOT|nr:polysaccharide pyruvyl transferase family protein [Clostridium boliviensis]MDW2799769.1 polysaccharide pyruvyl transferase family protein [Clostridium boliviensis]
MAKVGILSMQRIVNYGSFLQAFGLKAMLEDLGHEVQFVDYRVGAPLVEVKNKQRTGFKRKIYKAFEAINYEAPFNQKIQFILYKKQFAKKYHAILNLTTTPNYTPELDVLIVGSDEVFNCVQHNPKVGYSLELFGKDNRAKKVISYAASFGNTTKAKLQQYKKTDEIGNLLRDFEALSVRDENSAKVVRQLIGQSPKYHLDPVLAYDYIGKCKLIPIIPSKEKYLILYAYSLRISAEEANLISKYAKEKKLKIYAIGGVQKCSDRFIDCSPFEVLAYFINAEEVITDTFHGTIFSIIAKRQFTTLVRKSVGISYGNEEKLTDLLMRLNLSCRLIYDIRELSNIQNRPIDYAKIDFILEAERKRTQEYLELQIPRGNE